MHTTVYQSSESSTRDRSMPVEHIIQPTMTIKCPFEFGRHSGWQARVSWRNTEDGTTHSVTRRLGTMHGAVEWASGQLKLVCELD